MASTVRTIRKAKEKGSIQVITTYTKTPGGSFEISDSGLVDFTSVYAALSPSPTSKSALGRRSFNANEVRDSQGAQMISLFQLDLSEGSQLPKVCVFLLCHLLQTCRSFVVKCF